MKEIFEGKKILVTGGTGSIGSEIVKQVLKYNPKQVRVYSRDDTKQFHLDQELSEHRDTIRLLIGDIRNLDRLTRAMDDVDIVFHAAAMKHVPACENNPSEALDVNVIGTRNVINAAFDNNVEQVIMVSTDKAVNPINLLGTTKLMAEKLISSTYFHKGRKTTSFSTVRFGNVINSRGSVIPLFMNQIKNGGPVTITDPEMSRFFMTIPQAAKLVLKATSLSKGNETFILKMPALKLKDLVSTIVENCAPKMGIKPESIEIKKIGARPGEKNHELLLTEDEVEKGYETDELFIIPTTVPEEFVQPNTNYPGARLLRDGNYDSRKSKYLNKEEIWNLIKDNI